MAKKRRKPVGNLDLVTIECPKCHRHYTTKRTEVREDSRCWYCVKGIVLAERRE